MTSSTIAPTAEERDRTEEDLMQAVAVLWTEHDRVLEMLMAAIDLCELAQDDGRRVRFDNLRAAVGRKARESIAARDRVLAPFGIGTEEVK